MSRFFPSKPDVPRVQSNGWGTLRTTREGAQLLSLMAACVLVVGHPGLAQQSTPNPASARATTDPIEIERERLTDLAHQSYRDGDYDKSLDWVEKALSFAQGKLGHEHPTTIESINNLGYVLMMRGQYAEAEPHFQRAIELSERVQGKDHPYTLHVQDNLARVLASQGRYSESEQLFVRALEASERSLGRNDDMSLRLLNNLATLYVDQDRFVEGQRLFLRVLEATEAKLGKDHEKTLTTVNNLAAVYHGMKRFDDAERLFTRALKGREQTLGKEHPDTLYSINNLAAVYDEQNKYELAEQLYRRSLDISERVIGKDHPNTIITVSNLAMMYYDQGNLQKAEPLFVRAFEAGQRLEGSDHPSTIGRAFSLTRLRLRDPAKASSALESARFIVSSLRSRRAAEAGGVYVERQRAREQSREGRYFTVLPDAAWIAGAAEPGRASLTGEAFTALQDAMAGSAGRAVVQTAVRRLADEAGKELGALVSEREALSKRWTANLDSYSQALGETSGDSEKVKQDLVEERRQVETQIAKIDATLRESFPQYFALVRSEPLAVAAAQSILGRDEAILLVLPSEFGTHVVGVSSDSIQWTRSDWTRERVDAAVRRLLWDVGASVQAEPGEVAAWEKVASASYTFDRSTAHALYRQVVAPVAQVLAGKRHVFVAAGGSLSSLPFGILVTHAPEGNDGDPAALRDTKWFADAHGLIQIPSIQSLKYLRQSGLGTIAGVSDSRFVGFGDPVLNGVATVRGRERANTVARKSLYAGRSLRSGVVVADVDRIRMLNRLPGTAEELENMRVALGAPATALFLRERATEKNLRGLDLSRTSILAFATHGLVAGEIDDAAEPSLVFTPPAVASEEDDGLLSASEIAALRLNADWVIMSACNTASGDGSEGAPGLSGLARAFFYAGARNLLASHWPVRDEVAGRLTVRTIQLQRETAGLSRAQALQLAMREIRQDSTHDSAQDSWAHPNAWGPFTLIGDGAR